MRDLAGLMAKFGVFERAVTQTGERWRSPDALSLPSEALPLPRDFVDALDSGRWHHRVEPYAQRLIRYVCDDLSSPERVSTSGRGWRERRAWEPEAVRQGLASLIADGDFQVVRGEGEHQQGVNPETLTDHARLWLIIDWAALAEHRIRVRRG